MFLECNNKTEENNLDLEIDPYENNSPSNSD